MRGQQGIGTILILISVVLAAVIAAVLLIQTADQLRTKALNLQKQHEQLLMDRVIIKEIDGVVFGCGNEQCINYLLIKVSLAPGSDPFDLTKTLLGYTDPNVALEGIRYVAPEDLIYEFNVSGDPENTDLIRVHNLILDENISPYPACRATLMKVMQTINNYDIAYVAKVLDPFPLDSNDPRVGSFYTVLWTDCYDQGDTRSLLQNQEIIIFYRPKYPIHPSGQFAISIGIPQGYTEKKTLVAPRGFEGKIVTIYP